MKRIIAAILGISFVFTVCSCNRKSYKSVRIGIIDSCISKEIQEKMEIEQINDIAQIETDNNITHGSIITQIILQENPSCEIFYWMTN